MKNFSTSASLFSSQLSLNLGGTIMDLGTPRVMGIINATPDSFFDRSRAPEPDRALEKAKEMIEQGADILDIGASSSRPGAQKISEEEELQRLVPVLEIIRGRYPDFPVSVDTWRAGVARMVRERFNVQLINDISAGAFDPDMFTTIAGLGIPYIIMHMQGTPADMQEDPVYENVADELLQFFAGKVHELSRLGVNDIVVDPGFGFGKTLEQNYRLLSQLDAFRMLELPLMAGVSRKSMIYNLLDTDVDHALNGTTAVHMALLLQGVRILRVHDVKPAVETVKIFQQIY